MGIKKQKFLDMFPPVDQIESMSDEEIEQLCENVVRIQTPEIRTIPYAGEIDQEIHYNTPEVIAKCPMTRMIDVYDVDVLFVPNEVLPELKSLKKYFHFFNDLPVSHEHLLEIFVRDFAEWNAKELKVEMDVNVRGGIYTTVTYTE